MVTDQEIAREVDTLLRQAQPNAMTSLNDVIQQLEAKLGLNLSHKAGFIRDHINLLLRSTHTQAHVPSVSFPQNDHFAPQNYQHYPTVQHQNTQFYSHSTLQQQQQLPPASPVVVVQGKGIAQGPAAAAIAQVPAATAIDQGPAAAATATKGSAPAGTKRRGGQGGLNKVCAVSPELQAIVGEPALPRTEIVKQLWAYIRKHNLQDPSNKRKINCDEALRLVFETDCTDMFKMNKLLAKHIIAIDPSNQAKRSKVEVKSAVESSESVQPPVIISDALAKFFGTGEKEMLQSEALRRVWEYIKVNHLEDPLNSMVILCDAKLQELLGCESISAVGIPEMLTRHHLLNR